LGCAARRSGAPRRQFRVFARIARPRGGLDLQPPAPATVTAAKPLGFWTCTALVVGNTLGMGIFVLPASLAPYGLNALLGWLVTVAGSVVLALAFARLARDHPEADGPYDYIRVHFGDFAAFVAMWCYWVSIWVTNAALAIGIGGYLSTLLPAGAQAPPMALALVLLWLCAAINLLGARAGGNVQVVTTVLKLLPMAAVILLGAGLLITDPAAYTAHLPPNPISGAQVLAASTIALFAMTGVESAAVAASRVRDPARTVPRATVTGTLLAAVVCVALSMIVILLLPQAELAASPAPVADLLERHGWSGSGTWLAAFVVISGFGALNGWTLLAGETTRGLAAHGAFPAALRPLNGRGAPAAALLFVTLLATAMVLMNYSKTMVQGFTFLTLVVTAAVLPLYLLCAFALVWRMRDRAAGARGGRAAGNARTALVLLGTLGTAYCLLAFVGLGAEPLLWALALAAAGLPCRAWARRKARAAAGSVAP
jgi:APA family basic amino acid/polyamine antiporter